jgi:hypothetical protein
MAAIAAPIVDKAAPIPGRAESGEPEPTGPNAGPMAAPISAKTAPMARKGPVIEAKAVANARVGGTFDADSLIHDFGHGI